MNTGLSVFDASVQESNLWLKAIQGRLGDCQRQEAYTALRAVFHALRDRLQAESSVNFAAQLPMLLRGLFYEGWTLPDKPTRAHTLDDFADAVREELPPRFRFDPLMAARAVFSTITSFVSPARQTRSKRNCPSRCAASGPPVKRCEALGSTILKRAGSMTARCQDGPTKTDRKESVRSKRLIDLASSLRRHRVEFAVDAR